MEPVIYRNNIPPAYQADFDVLGRVAAKSTPTVSNEQAYDAIYPSHKAWYDEKKYMVIDNNFSQVENTLLNVFEDTLDKGLDKNQAKNLKHAENFDKDQFNIKSLDFSRIPRSVPTLIKGDNYNHQITKVTINDPYKEVFGDKLV